jgi:hypothetical protein
MTPTESMGFNDRGETFPDKEPKQPVSDEDIDELAEKEYPFGGMCVSQVKRAFKKGIKLNNILLNEALSIIDELINKAASVKDTGNAIKRAKNFLLNDYKAAQSNTQPIWIDIMQIDSKWDEYSHFITEINEHWKYMTRAEFIKAVTELLPNNNQSI